MALADEAPGSTGQLTTIEVADRAGVKDGNDRERALDAAMHALRIPVVKMRAHDAKRQIPLDAVVELVAPEPPAQRLLPGDEQSAAKECADWRP